jgi:hypothetical protein
MLLVASLFSIKNRNARDFFVRSVRRGGSWQTAACRIAPDLIELDAFEPIEDAPKAIYLCLDLWNGAEAYHRACCSPDVQALFLARRQLADSSFKLGAFAFAATEDLSDAPRPCVN